eukprot:2115840-Prymnesium_polylepis.1
MAPSGWSKASCSSRKSRSRRSRARRGSSGRNCICSCGWPPNRPDSRRPSRSRPTGQFRCS